eukprot:359412-Chlamydomonas_euryale.AAC.6
MQGYKAKVTGKTAEERLDMRAAQKSDKVPHEGPLFGGGDVHCDQVLCVRFYDRQVFDYAVNSDPQHDLVRGLQRLFGDGTTQRSTPSSHLAVP